MKQRLWWRNYRVVVALCVGVLAGCDAPESLNSMPVPNAPQRQNNPQQLAMGEKIFQENCAGCHGEQGQGAAKWHKKGADGFYPAPPLNGSGHTWHHSLAVLEDTITNGSSEGKGKMPAWKGKLSQKEIQATMVWFQSQWPQPVYDAWYEMQQRGK